MSTKEGIPQFMGVRIKRREDPDLVTGKGKYVADIAQEKLLHMAVVRSPYAHARILSIDASEAQSMAGVVGVFTGEDLNPLFANPLPMVIPLDGFPEKKNPRRYPLTTGKVRHTGDPVAVVVAEDRYTAADALEMIFVDYEPLDAVTDPFKSLEAGAPVIHEEWDDNLAYKFALSAGDIDAAFAEADTVVELRVVNQRVIPNAMEPRAVTANYDADADMYTIWSSTQTPHALKEDLAAMFGVPSEKLHVIAPEVGGGFGVKAVVYGEEALVPILAKKLGRPVRWVATRSEDYVATNHGRDQIDTMRIAAKSDGTILAVDLDIVADVGAYYGRITPTIIPLTAQMMTGVYDVSIARTLGRGVFTNKVATEPYRGAGRPEAAYMIERAMTYLAQELNMDPAEVRRKNFIAPEKFPYKTASGALYDSGEYAKNLDKALELADYESLRAEQARRRQAGGKPMGIGLACYVEVCGFGPFEAATVTVDEDAKVIVLTGSSPHGQGHETSWSQIAAETLQIPMEDITVKHGDTKVVPKGVGTFGSRSAPVGGSAVLANAKTVREKAIEIAAHLLEAAAADVTLVDGSFQVRGVPERTITWQEVVKAADNGSVPEELAGPLSAEADFAPQGETYPFGTHICVVEIEPETGKPTILRYLTVDDCGHVINPLIVEGQVHGGITQGLGQALFEGAVYDEIGNLVSGSLMDYSFPRAHFLPSYDTNRTETPTPYNEMGVKGIGEAATIGSTPAVANAVVDALSHLGVRNLDMPLTSEKIWQALQANS